MNRTVLAIWIIFLLIGVSVVSSTSKKVEDNTVNNKFSESVNNEKGILSCDHLGYVFSSGQDCFLYEFILNNPSDLTCVCEEGGSGNFFTDVTWSCYDNCIYCVEYATGVLWRIDPDSCEIWSIGGGGTSLNCLAHDSVTDRMYGVGNVGYTDTLYEVDPDTGMQEKLFDLDYSGGLMIGISFNSEGVLYGWDLVTDKLWIIDIEAETVEEVGPLGINLNYAVPGDFCKEDDILYLVIYNSLYASGEYVGDFQGSVTVTGLVIPYQCDYSPPVTTHSLEPSEPDGANGWYVSDVNVTLNATDYKSGVKEIKYRVGYGPFQTINGDNGTFTITQEDDADDLPIEYWAIDNAGNEETPNVFYIDMDQTKPTIDLTYEVIGGNPWIGWDFLFTATCSDVTSGMDRVEFYLNDELQSTVYGYGPTYEWEYHYPEFSGNISVRGLICNPVITDEYVKFYALIVRVRAIFDGDLSLDVCAYSYDKAGNWALDVIEEPCPQIPIEPGFYLFQNLILPNNYTGYIGKYFIFTIFNNCSYHKIKTFGI